MCAARSSFRLQVLWNDHRIPVHHVGRLLNRKGAWPSSVTFPSSLHQCDHSYRFMHSSCHLEQSDGVKVRVSVDGSGHAHTISQGGENVVSGSSVIPISNRETGRPFSSIPSVTPSYPIVGSLFDVLRYSKEGGYHRFYLHVADKFGPIVRFKLLGNNFLCLSNPNEIKQTYMLDQSLPRREAVEPWSQYRVKRKLPQGVAMSLSQSHHDVDEWRRWRRLVQPLLQPPLVSTYVPRVSIVAADFVTAILNKFQHQRGNNASCSSSATQVVEDTETFSSSSSSSSRPSATLTVKELSTVTGLFGFEAINAILMGKRMNVLLAGSGGAGDAPVLSTTAQATVNEAQQFINAVGRMFEMSDRLLFQELPFWRLFETKSLRAHDAAWDDMFSIGRRLIEHRHHDRVFHDAPDYFTFMQQHHANENGGQEISVDDFNLVATELVSAGVDTTSNAAQWIVWALAQYPQAQQRLADEVKRIVGSDVTQPLTEELLKKVKANAFVDEILRLFPVLPAGSRMFDRDVLIGGYTIPAWTRIVMNNMYASRNSANHPNPFAFDETRKARRECPFSSTTFGFGARQCVGQRIAQMELQTLLVRLVQSFEITCEPRTGDQQMHPGKARLLLSIDPSSPYKFTFTKRI